MVLLDKKYLISCDFWYIGKLIWIDEEMNKVLTSVVFLFLFSFILSNSAHAILEEIVVVTQKRIKLDCKFDTLSELVETLESNAEFYKEELFIDDVNMIPLSK